MAWNPNKPSNRKWGAFSRFRKPRKIPAAAIPKSIARVRTDWLTLYSPFGNLGTGACGYSSAPWTPELPGCVRTFGIQVVNSSDLSVNYGDDVKIVAMVGKMRLRPVFENADRCIDSEIDAYLLALENYHIVARGGLYRQDVVQTEIPGGSTPHPMGLVDWSDARWLKTWEKAWLAPPIQLQQTIWNDNQFTGPFGSVFRSQYTVPVTTDGSQASYNVPAIQTNCNDCYPDEGQCLKGGTTRRYLAPGWKTVSLNMRREIRLHEEQSLEWFVDWANIGLSTFGPDPCGYDQGATNPCAMQFAIELKVKLQYG